jgi:hypothetical protein
VRHAGVPRTGGGAGHRLLLRRGLLVSLASVGVSSDSQLMTSCGGGRGQGHWRLGVRDAVRLVSFRGSGSEPNDDFQEHH